MNTERVPLRCARDNGVTKFCEIVSHLEGGVNHRVFVGCHQRDGSKDCGDCLSGFQSLLEHNPNSSPATLARFHNDR